MKKWQIEFGGSVIVEADTQEEAGQLARERIEHDSDWATQRRCRNLGEESHAE